MKRISLVCIFLMLNSCAERQNSLAQLGGQVPSGSTIQQMDLAEPGRLVIVDDSNTPVPNANVLIGQAPGNPFEGNNLKTDSSGQVHMPPNFKSDLPMTISAEGYVTQTYLRFSPNSTMARLHKKETATRVEVKGTTTNFTNVNDGDGKIDFGLVIPSLSKSQLLAFDLSTVLSPEVDVISIAGKEFQLPSNISLPEQHEMYKIVIPVDLDKPTYRTPLRESGTRHFNAVRGWFPMTKVIDDLRAGKSVFDVINSFTFTTMGSRDVTANADISGQDIDVSQTAMDAEFATKAPSFDKSKAMLSLAMAEENGRFTVTDLKRLNSGQTMNLKGSSKMKSRQMLSALMENTSRGPAIAPAGLGANDLLNVLPDADKMFALATEAAAYPNFRQLSFAFLSEGEPAPTFMPLVTAPTVNKNVVQLQVPALPAGLRVVGTYVVFSDIVPGAGDKVKAEIRTRLWEIWNEGWTNTLTLPEVTFAKVPGHTYRWEVMFLASNKSSLEAPTDGWALNIDGITHVTRNAINVQ